MDIAYCRMRILSRLETIFFGSNKDCRKDIMSEAVVKVEGVSKKYCRTLKHTMLYGVADLTKSFIGLKQHTEKLRNGEFWAANDVSFELKRGDCLGLIGPNGSGKSTLLKMMNGIFMPDKGTIEINGRVSALIEVGAGFHPMLTGRENIYINGAILGMSKKEIDAKYDKILEFAGIGAFINSPVKHYSSGMFVRLGFAVAVHCEPDILLIDEVLAVGDAEFRAKCYNRIAELMGNCAVVVVSHDMPMLARMASNCTVLREGKLTFHGSTPEAIQYYYSTLKKGGKAAVSEGVNLLRLDIKTKNHAGNYIIDSGAPMEVALELCSDKDAVDVSIILSILAISGEYVAEWNSWFNHHNLTLKKGCQKFNIMIDRLSLNPGAYTLSLVVTSENSIMHLLWIDKGWTLKVTGSRIGNAPYEIPGTITAPNN